MNLTLVNAYQSNSSGAIWIGASSISHSKSCGNVIIYLKGCLILKRYFYKNLLSISSISITLSGVTPGGATLSFHIVLVYMDGHWRVVVIKSEIINN